MEMPQVRLGVEQGRGTATAENICNIITFIHSVVYCWCLAVDAEKSRKKKSKQTHAGQNTKGKSAYCKNIHWYISTDSSLDQTDGDSTVRHYIKVGPPNATYSMPAGSHQQLAIQQRKDTGGIFIIHRDEMNQQ